MAKKKSATSKPTAKKQTELLAIEVPKDLADGMDIVGITDREQYITFLIASSLLNYQAIFKDEKMEARIQKIKSNCDAQNHLR